ncbi:MAG: hypothetical protein R2875_05420 [Desulfobacterales bacterium]
MKLKSFCPGPIPTGFFTCGKPFWPACPVDAIFQLTAIDPWFLYQFKQITDMEQAMRHPAQTLPRAAAEQAKGGIFRCSAQLLAGRGAARCPRHAKAHHLQPVYKLVDTMPRNLGRLPIIVHLGDGKRGPAVGCQILDSGRWSQPHRQSIEFVFIAVCMLPCALKEMGISLSPWSTANGKHRL